MPYQKLLMQCLLLRHTNLNATHAHHSHSDLNAAHDCMTAHQLLHLLLAHEGDS